jgi:thiol-disulfide isomerase/thioredoxin
VKRWVLASALLACNPTPKEAVKAEPTSSSAMTAASPSPSPSPSVKGRIRLVTAEQDSDALSLIRTERLKAKADGRVLVVYVSATWCEPCKKMKEEIDAGRLDDRYGKTTLLAFDADKDIDRLGAAGYTFKFVPYVALPGSDGKPAETQEAVGKGATAWKELLGKLDAWQAR